MDQGSQFTYIDFIKALKDAKIQISMDGKGAWRGNFFVVRLWRTIKYEEVYLHAYESVSAARNGFRRYIQSYNTRRSHSSLDAQPTLSGSNTKRKPVEVINFFRGQACFLCLERLTAGKPLTSQSPMKTLTSRSEHRRI